MQPIFARLSDRLRADGAQVFHVNFNCGDAAYWAPRTSWAFRENLSALEGFLAQKCEAHGLTDVVLFGDRRPVHRPVQAVSVKYGARVHVFEEGYFRPHWVILERGGVNKYSSLPRDPQWYREMAVRVPRHRFAPVQTPLWPRAMHDAAYHLANLGNPLFYPRYRTHAPCIAGLDYAGWARRFPLLPLHERRDAVVTARLVEKQLPFFILPLQLDSDAQIFDNSPFTGMVAVIDFVLRSFAAHAPGNTHLVIKNHPFDTGFVGYRKQIRRLAEELALAGRVHFMEMGDLPILVRHAKGVATVNSTLGTAALGMGCPVLTMADPIYNLPGITAQSGIDRFWAAPVAPDAALFEAFRDVVMHGVMINGGFYTRPSIKMAVEGAMRLMLPPRSPLEELLS